jgi:hypothetical protein
MKRPVIMAAYRDLHVQPAAPSCGDAREHTERHGSRSSHSTRPYYGGGHHTASRGGHYMWRRRLLAQREPLHEPEDRRSLRSSPTWVAVAYQNAMRCNTAKSVAVPGLGCLGSEGSAHIF